MAVTASKNYEMKKQQNEEFILKFSVFSPRDTKKNIRRNHMVAVKIHHKKSICEATAVSFVSDWFFSFS